MILAHGIGGRQDLPIPFSLALWGAAGVLIVTFGALAVLWKRPRLNRPDGGVALPAGLTGLADAPATRAALRVLGILLTGYVVVAAVAGPDDALNPTAGVVYVLFWVGLVPLSLLFGPVWRLLNPLRSIHWLLARAAGRDPAVGPRVLPPRLGYWPAAIGLLAFAWLELVAPDRASTSTLKLFFAVYAVAMLVGASLYGSTWFDRCDAFEVWSSLIARMSPLGRRTTDRSLVLRSPLVGMATTPVLPGLAAVVVVSLGSTAFDGFSRTDTWLRVIQAPGRSTTLFGTLGLLGALLVVAVTYVAATAPVGRDAPNRFAPSMLPIAVGYVVAHYFSLFVFEGQHTLQLLSDPTGDGADLLGTGGGTVNYTLISVSTIAGIRAGAVLVGHVLAVVLAHDRALEDAPAGGAALGVQLPLLTTMVGYTLAALLVLLR
ncbi:MAG: hypothetical protein QOK42_2139 [Frankiaceae bacterium]|jgi:hypothetical protein|nr:hypothetical protein [Frankiaceae bacterium]MDX6225173.1 hypothetical protein [Frankiales bacterium]